jgi:hypothetical protein
MQVPIVFFVGKESLLVIFEEIQSRSFSHKLECSLEKNYLMSTDVMPPRFARGRKVINYQLSGIESKELSKTYRLRGDYKLVRPRNSQRFNLRNSLLYYYSTCIHPSSIISHYHWWLITGITYLLILGVWCDWISIMCYFIIYSSFFLYYQIELHPWQYPQIVKNQYNL